MMKDKDDKSARKRGGWPAWEQEAKQILNGISAHVFQYPDATGIVALGQAALRRGDDNTGYFVFHADFLPILDAFLSHLISWTEQRDVPELREWAGRALADRLQFLSTQQRDWCNENEGFKKRREEFRDRRQARSPRSYLGWLAGDYLRTLIEERNIAGLLLSALPGSVGKSASVAKLAANSEERISWLKKLQAMPDFSADSAAQWGDVVFERMKQDEQMILNSRQMPRHSRDSMERRRSGKVKLFDFERTIVGAVARLASKPVGPLRGINRPV